MTNIHAHDSSPLVNRKFNVVEVIANVLRGILIGMAELVPGISGGTVALVIGIYERALINARRLMRMVITRSKTGVEWPFLIAVGIGMVGAVVTLAGPIHFFVETYAVESRALFFGMVIASIAVPVRMIFQPAGAKEQVKKSWLRYLLVIISSAVAAFIATGFVDHSGSGSLTSPPLWLIFVGAAVAVCALVLPGVSGSFVLLSLGLYSPVMAALKDRDLQIIFIFIAGALVGLSLFIRVLGIALDKYRTGTLVLMTGLMTGSLRALWPWQGEYTEINIILTFACIVIGLLVVIGVMLTESRLQRKNSAA